MDYMAYQNPTQPPLSLSNNYSKKENINYRKLIKKGKCICIYEPRGEYGLEGYILNIEYKFELWRPKRKYDKFYYKIFVGALNYYDTCQENIFRKYFKKIKE